MTCEHGGFCRASYIAIVLVYDLQVVIAVMLWLLKQQPVIRSYIHQLHHPKHNLCTYNNVDT